MTFETIFWLVVAICLIATVIGAFIAYVKIPEPFAWVKGILTFLLIAGACLFLWQMFVASHLGHAPTHF